MKVIKNSTIYFGVSIIQSLMSFFLLPVFTFYLDKYQFGLASVVNSVAGLLGIFYTLGFSGVVARLYFDYDDNPEQLKRFIGTAFLFNFILGVALSLLMYFGRDIIFPFISKGVDFYPYSLIAIGIALFLTPFELYQVLMLTKQEGWKYGITTVVYLVLNNVITVLLISVFGMKAEGVVLGTLIANVLMFIYMLFALRKQMKLVIDVDILKKSFSYAWPILLHAFFTWCLASVNRLIVNNQLGTNDVGSFTIGFTIGGIVSMVAVALNRSFSPWFFQQLKKQKSDNSDVVSFAQFIVVVYAVCGFGLSLFAPEAISLLTHGQYSVAWRVVPPVAFAYVFQGIYFFFLGIFNYEKKWVKLVPLFSVIGAVINIGLNYILVSKYGIIGSGIATMVSIVSDTAGKPSKETQLPHLRLIEEIPEAVKRGKQAYTAMGIPQKAMEEYTRREQITLPYVFERFRQYGIDLNVIIRSIGLESIREAVRRGNIEDLFV